MSEFKPWRAARSHALWVVAEAATVATFVFDPARIWRLRFPSFTSQNLCIQRAYWDSAGASQMACGGRCLAGMMGVAIMALLFEVPSARAQEWWTSTRDGIPDISTATSLPQNGDPSGNRKRLSERGVVYGLEYTNDILSNVRGGLRTGTIDQGKIQAIATVDFDKLAGWQGLTAFANAFQIHNTGRIRRDYVGGLNTIAAIEAVPTTRLSEIWFEQKFADGKASIRVGQLAADAEFFIAQVSTAFLQSDWPTIFATNLPSGGPAYPLSTPGARLKVEPVSNVALLLGVFNGDPAGPGVPGQEQQRNRYGLNFRVNDPPLVIGEAQFRRNAGADDRGLSTTLKVGGWYHFGAFDDMRFALGGRLLADPASSGLPLQRHGNSAIYATIEQQLSRPAGGDAQSGISIYGRMAASPSDRNLIDAYIDGGIVFAGLIPNRPKDWFGASVIHARFSTSARAFDRDVIAFTGIDAPVRTHETNLELTYSAQIVPGWTIQPDLQRIWHPGGNPRRTATVAGVRSQWRY
jgi:porin